MQWYSLMSSLTNVIMPSQCLVYMTNFYPSPYPCFKHAFFMLWLLQYGMMGFLFTTYVDT